MSERISIMHLVDSLAIGGTERVATNLVNSLPRNRYQSYLCVTRCEGPLAQEIDSDVKQIVLTRRHTFDAGAMFRLVAFIRNHGIALLHAHSSTLFVAAVASLFPPFPKVIWHDHYGHHAVIPRPVLPFWLLTRRAAGVICVSEPLADWSRRTLRVSSNRVWFIPNFVCPPDKVSQDVALPGIPGQRIVCVANLRPQKDHLTLLQAMARVVQAAPRAHLILVGAASNATHRDLVLAEIVRLGLELHVTWFGSVHNVFPILQACDIGVLSSVSEGLPLALIEYGMAGLPVVATNVGQCADVLDGGDAGLLVPPGAPDVLAAILLQLLESPGQRANLGTALLRRSRMTYSAETIIGQICAVYDQVLGSSHYPLEYLPPLRDLTEDEQVYRANSTKYPS